MARRKPRPSSTTASSGRAGGHDHLGAGERPDRAALVAGPREADEVVLADGVGERLAHAARASGSPQASPGKARSSGRDQHHGASSGGGGAPTR